MATCIAAGPLSAAHSSGGAGDGGGHHRAEKGEALLVRGGGFGLELGGPDGDARGVLVLDAASVSSPSEPAHSSSVL